MWRSLFLCSVATSMLWSVDAYRIEQGCALVEGAPFVLLRKFTKENTTYYFGAHTSTLKTALFSHFTPAPCDPSCPYETLKAQALQNNHPINGGITQGKPHGMALTIDMCPSSKSGFEAHFYETLTHYRSGMPIGVSITGRWIMQHRVAFEQLFAWEKSGALAISWINHGMNHPYDAKIEVAHNFINLPHVEFDAEVIELEKMLFDLGVLPSIFYRFAGLVANEKAHEKLISHYGLIPLGSQAWLAKEQEAKNGSIILVHGNRNEPQGITKALELLKTNPSIISIEALLR